MFLRHLADHVAVEVVAIFVVKALPLLHVAWQARIIAENLFGVVREDLL